LPLLNEHPKLLNQCLPGHKRSLLWESVRYGRDALAMALLERGADVNLPGRNRAELCILLKPWVIARIRKRDRLVSLLEAETEQDLLTRCFIGDLQGVNQMLREDPEALNRPQKDDEIWQVLPLHAALLAGKDELVDLLLAAGSNLDQGEALLYEIAISKQRLDQVKQLTRYGGNPACVGISTLFHSSEEMLQYFLEQGLDVHRPAVGAWPPLVYACRGDRGEHPELIKRLLALGLELEARGPKGRTAVHAAAQAGHVEVLKLLLDAGADPNAQMDSGERPVDLARRKKRSSVLAFYNRMGITG